MEKKHDPERVLRGGSSNYYQASCRAAFRSCDVPDYRFDYIGFRLVAKGGTCNGKAP